MGLIIIIMKFLVLMVTLIEAATAAKIFEVGGSDGWKVPPAASFYNNWASEQTFSVGDTLEFKWTSTHNVEEVTKSAYDNCTTANGTLQLWSSTNPVSVPLNSTTARYFICTIGTHCSEGQKLAITSVSETNSTTTPSGTSPSGSSASTPTTAALLSALLISTTAIVSFFNI